MALPQAPAAAIDTPPDTGTAAAAGYSGVSIALHWIVAALTIYLFVNGEQFAGLPRGPEAGALRALHNSVGMIAILVFALRIVWRIRRGTPPAGNESPALNLLAGLVHWGLLAALVVLSVTGPLAIWSGGRGIAVFGLFTIPSPMARNGAVHLWSEVIHGYASDALVPLVLLHVAGAIKHSLSVREMGGGLIRMLRAVPRGH
ncbi:MAG: cytochrome b/b6 domain-containing protein [Alphaproteobacteria bacterium]|nr:cytochrome b/b6 domain-containing protein [Alphaproteobacteria bacterium]